MPPTLLKAKKNILRDAISRRPPEYLEYVYQNNIKYARVCSVIVCVLMGYYSFPVWIDYLSGARLWFSGTLDFASITFHSFIFYIIMSILLFWYNGRWKYVLPWLLAAYVLMGGYILGIDDVRSDSSIIALVLSGLFVAGFLSMPVLWGLLLLTLFYLAFYSALMELPSVPGYHVSDMVAAFITTAVLFYVIETGRRRQYDFQVKIAEQLSDLSDQNDRLEQAIASKDQFISHISHEFRTPLNAVIGFSEVIGDKSLALNTPEKVEEYAEIINRSGKHLLTLVNNILMLNKDEAGSLEPQFENIDLSKLFHDILPLVAPEIEARGQKLITHYPDNALYVRVDRMMLKQVLLNILSNAVKYTPPNGAITVEVKERNKVISVAVQDSGVGMTEAELEKALEPFQQISSVYNRQNEGTGLGLPIMKQLCDKQDIVLNFKSEKGLGTTVSLLFNLS